ncbi:SAM-dependent methyltransferase [Desulfuromonas versatilis]|uniref:SAM-dependent methyltransferase n=1 Tax=Desulfuromonas versatilis TaxID=2802975 RepID=A0ABM8HZJ1_9BACT|nr:methyltransferase domain-containing protein [Desulfuromonas versatilis]BCR06202.1 SAM-dependent methyltransferase [Desulfuromonas versatilis]
MSEPSWYFHAELARQILQAMTRGLPSVEISVDLNISRTSLPLDSEGLILGADNRLNKAELEWIAGRENRIFCLEQGRLEVLEARGEGYYKLVPTEGAPLLEISGVKMHISKGIDPFESAGQMAAQVVKKGSRVLDTCSGLGYAASAALRLGAREVVSVEKSTTVMALRARNPWSRGIFGANIQLVHADIDDYIRGLAAESFDVVIHDPPRFSLAGELYGERFYREIHRVLKRRGALFHYTGNPYLAKRGGSFMDQAARRLKEAGFAKVVPVVALMGLSALK